ncbi:MAG: pyruvate, phosphate dikinase, partial [Bradyrhizobium sp.]|nr:pyruvate, phosphate dikinase [Bradyrhizobium sp.]
KTYKAGDSITLNGTKGLVYAGKLDMIDATENPRFMEYMKIVDKRRTMGVRTNADTPEDAKIARGFGAEGIGLFRTEHMFYGVGSDAALFQLRKMILSSTDEERNAAIDGLAPFVKKDIKATLEAMDGLPVTIRLLDPPLHEFLPHTDKEVNALAKKLKTKPAILKAKVESLHEFNPMLGFRGCRIAIAYPEIAEMQARAIFEAAVEAGKRTGKPVGLEVMVPLIATKAEFDLVKARIDATAAAVAKETGKKLDYQVGTMIELPRACLMAGEVAETAEFFSFGTNDLTQTTYGISRDDAASFLSTYVAKGILEIDPFISVDRDGVGELVKIGVQRGRKTRPNLKVGICGEHGGDPASVAFCHQIGLNYVSCSPYRVPIARLAAAQAALGKAVASQA